MLTVNRTTVLEGGYEKASRLGIEPYLSGAELTKMYGEKMMAYGQDCGYTFTEEEVKNYIANQQSGSSALRAKNDAPIALRFQ